MWGKEMNRKIILLLMLTVVLTVMMTACAPKEEEPLEVIAVAWSRMSRASVSAGECR